LESEEGIEDNSKMHMRGSDMLYGYICIYVTRNSKRVDSVMG